MDATAKITAKHLSRIGYVYIRQSTAYQVSSNTESTLRQYALRDRLAALGWDTCLIHTIDSDLGFSGKTSDAREWFQQLMSDVANGLVGAIACIEASRLSRCSGDWMRLIEICSMTDTLLLDSDGIYNPNDFNDRICSCQLLCASTPSAEIISWHPSDLFVHLLPHTYLGISLLVA